MPSPRQRSPRHVSGYLRDNALRKQLEERVKETARTRQAAEDGLRAAQDMIDQARRVDANVTEAEKALAEAGGAMVAKDYKVAVEKANEALERGKRNYRDRARAIVDSSANLGRLAKGVGADLAETESTSTWPRRPGSGARRSSKSTCRPPSPTRKRSSCPRRT